MLFTNVLAQQDSTTTNIQSGNAEIYEGLVLGVGSGTLAVCAFAVLGLIICFFKDCSATPCLMVAAGILVPVIVLLIIIGIPKQSLATDTQKEDTLPTDAYRVRTGIFSALIFLVCFAVSFLMCIGKMTTLSGMRVDSEQAEIQNARRLKNLQ